MDHDHHLRTADLLDCNGRIAHRLTLRIDGNVDVELAGGHTTVADPRTRTCLTPSMTIPHSLWPQIEALAI